MLRSIADNQGLIHCRHICSWNITKFDGLGFITITMYDRFHLNRAVTILGTFYAMLTDALHYRLGRQAVFLEQHNVNITKSLNIHVMNRFMSLYIVTIYLPAHVPPLRASFVKSKHPTIPLCSCQNPVLCNARTA